MDFSVETLDEVSTFVLFLKLISFWILFWKQIIYYQLMNYLDTYEIFMSKYRLVSLEKLDEYNKFSKLSQPY